MAADRSEPRHGPPARRTGADANAAPTGADANAGRTAGARATRRRRAPEPPPGSCAADAHTAAGAQLAEVLTALFADGARSVTLHFAAETGRCAVTSATRNEPARKLADGPWRRAHLDALVAGGSVHCQPRDEASVVVTMGPGRAGAGHSAVP